MRLFPVISFLVLSCLISFNAGNKICYSATEGMHTKGLTHVKQDTLNNCKKYCTHHKYCQIFDFVTKSHKCWVQTKDIKYEKKDLKKKEGVVNHVRIDCKPKPFHSSCWIHSPGKHIIGLTQVNTDDIGACKQYCLDIEGCRVIDVDHNSSPQCWIQRKEMKVGEVELKPMPEVTDFILKNVCKNRVCWEERPETQYIGLERFDTDSIFSCRLRCLNSPYCRVFSYIPGSKQNCWIQSKPGIEEVNYKENSAVSTYTLKKECKNRFCWKRQRNYKIINLVHYPNVSSKKKCMDACVKHPTCVVAQFRKGGKCMLNLHGAPLFKGLRPVNRYEILRKSCKDTQNKVLQS